MAAAIYQNNGCVEAIISKTYPTTLMRVVSATSATVAARATACIQPDNSPPCILSLYCGEDDPGLEFNGNGILIANACDVVINSQADDSIRFNGAGSCPPEHLQVLDGGTIAYGQEGGILQNGANECILCPLCEGEDGGPLNSIACYQDPYCEGLVLASDDYPLLCQPLADPWPAPAGIVNWPEARVNGGNWNNLGVFPACPSPGDTSLGACFDAIAALPALTGYPPGALLLPPGYYGGVGVRITGGRVIFDCDDDVNGCLYMGSQLFINGGTVIADDVTYYITPDGSPASAGLNINGNAGAPPDLVRFTAPTGGTYQNMVFFSSRYTTAKDCTINGGANLLVEGTVYCPTGQLEFGGNSGVIAGGTGVFATLVGYTIELNGNPNLGINFGATGRNTQFNVVALVE